MSIIPASRLSASDLALLGNNFAEQPHGRGDDGLPRRRLVAYRGELTAVNRSLAVVGERVGRLPAPAGSIAATSGVDA